MKELLEISETPTHIILNNIKIPKQEYQELREKGLNAYEIIEFYILKSKKEKPQN